MMNKNYDDPKNNMIVNEAVRTIGEKYDAIKQIYHRIIEGKDKSGFDNSVKKLVAELLIYQKEDGSFSVTDSYKGDNDYIVEYVFFPTYYATAALMCADSYLKNGLGQEDIECLKSGLVFAIRRNLIGSGYEATEMLIKTLRLYAKAGMYRWIQMNAEAAPEFKQVIDTHYKKFVKAVAEGKTFSDWNKDFVDDFKREIEEYEKYNSVYVWYAAYGSNVNEERFMQYINSCTDSSAPIDNRKYILKRKIYFGGRSRRWNGAVAFLDLDSIGIAFGRIYLIKKTQLDEIQIMEGNSYTERVLLEFIDDVPVYTFTSPSRRNVRTMPSKEYLETIETGLRDLHNKADVAVQHYLYSRGFLTQEDMKILDCIRSSEHAITVAEIREKTGISKTMARRSVKELECCGLIVQDSRTRGVSIEDDTAMVFTRKEKRAVIDVLIFMD